MKKAIVTMDIDYPKEITNITFPYLKQYANKINADFIVINTRKYPDQPITLEKFQLYDISKDYDWTIWIDADAIIHPYCFDLTEIYSKEYVILDSRTYINLPYNFKHNIYTRRDGRGYRIPTWITVVSDWTRDLWKPYKDPKQFLPEILSGDWGSEGTNNTNKEIHLDDYLTTRNLSKYGLKVKFLIQDYFPSIDAPEWLLHHTPFIKDINAKIRDFREYERRVINQSGDK